MNTKLLVNPKTVNGKNLQHLIDELQEIGVYREDSFIICNPDMDEKVLEIMDKYLNNNK